MRNGRLVLVGGIIFASEVIWQLYKRFVRYRKETVSCRASYSGKNINKAKENISEVMFFSEDSSACRAHVVKEKACHRGTCPIRHLRKLESYINNAEDSVDVCMYMFTCQSLSKAILNAHKRGVLVRIIMDRQMAFNDAAQTSLFHNNGVAVRFHQLDVLMHHKFAIVDSDIVITGSTNWTMSAFFGNFDNIIVTNHSRLVKPFVQEFEKLWMAFESPAFSQSAEIPQRMLFDESACNNL